MRVDLHIHTTASDGSWNPASLVAEVKSAEIGLFAVTDHDTVGGIAETALLAKAAGLKFIPGVEISTTLGGQSFHILGYGIQPDSRALIKLLQYNTGLMEETDHNSIKQLIARGYRIDYEEYRGYKSEAGRGGWKSLNFLIDKGLCRNVNEFFASLFTTQNGIRFPEFPPPSAAVAAIRAAGGLAILAHPGSSFHGPELEETLDFFAKEAIDGIECYHPGHDETTIKRAVSWCRRRNLMITGGSDCHGTFVSQRKLGQPVIWQEDLELGRLAPF